MKIFSIVNNLFSIYKEDGMYLLNDKDTLASAISIILDRFHHALDPLICPIPTDWLLILADFVAENEEKGQTSICHLLYRHVICCGSFVGTDGVLKDFYPPTVEECLKFDEDGFLDLTWMPKIYPTYEDYKKKRNAEEWTADMLLNTNIDPCDIEDILGLYDGQALFKVYHGDGTDEVEFLDEETDESIREGVRIAKESIAAALQDKKIVPRDLYDYITPIQFAEILSFRELIMLMVIESGIFIGGHFEDFDLPENCISYKNGCLLVPENSDEMPVFFEADRETPVETVYFTIPDPDRKGYQEFNRLVFDE